MPFGNSEVVSTFFQLMNSATEEIAGDKVVHVMTDIGPNNEAIGQLSIKVIKQLYWKLCAAHYQPVSEDIANKL